MPRPILTKVAKVADAGRAQLWVVKANGAYAPAVIRNKGLRLIGDETFPRFADARSAALAESPAAS